MRALSGKEPKVNLSELLTGTEPDKLRIGRIKTDVRCKRFDDIQACKVSIGWLIISTAEMARSAEQWT